MNEKVKCMNLYFENQIAFCNQEQKTLLEDDRTDEATFQKIKANVYDIFRTILSVAQKNGNSSPEAVKHFFLVKTEQIPSNWNAAYEMAKQHNDTEKMLIEKLKLDTVHEIRNQFLTLWEETE